MVCDIVLLGNGPDEPVDEAVKKRVDADGTEEDGRRHGSLLNFVRCCGNKFHFGVGQEILLRHLSNHQCVKLRAHRNRRCQGGDDEGSRHQEPRDNGEANTAEHVQDHDRGNAQNQLDDKGRPHPQGRIKAQLNRQENRIEQSRWAQIFNETHLQVLQLNKKKMDDASMVQQMTGCTRDEAEKALLAHETVIDAISALIPENPVTSGNKYIPVKPKVETGMDREQAALCERGRWLQDRVNAVFSVGHSKTLPVPPAEQSSLPSVEVVPAVAVVAEVSESSPDSLAQTAQPAPQSEPPQ